MSDCECKDMSLDMKTPMNAYLSGFYKRSFAYHTVRNRMPVILTQIIDDLCRNKMEIVEKYGEESAEELKQVIGGISKFKYEVQTNKPLAKLSAVPDADIYNQYINQLSASGDGEVTHFNTIWLLTECYMYTRLHDIFLQTKTLRSFDYFESSKIQQYEKSKALMLSLSKYVIDIQSNPSEFNEKTEVIKMLKMNLWGNKCDLSISLGKVSGPENLHDVEELQSFVLADDSEKVYAQLKDSSDKQIIDVILDNAGYELFTDLCLIDVLTSFKLASQVRFHVKARGWFVSDVLTSDFKWTLEQLSNSDDVNLSQLGNTWKERITNGSWSIVEQPFWTLPYEYKFMQEKDAALYSFLSQSKLIIFKGDLNYRKLFGERNWATTTPPKQALEGFLPTSLCTLRTIKADIVVGLKPGVAEDLEKKDVQWMEKGDYGLIQFVGK